MIGGKVFIAEVKTQSPFGFKSKHTWDELFEVALQVGDMISIHTDALWGGSFSLLEKARKRTNKLILAKGIHENDDLVKNALDAGADWVLVVGRIPTYMPNKCWIEPHSLDEFRKYLLDILTANPSQYPTSSFNHFVWNSRNLFDGSLKTSSIFDVKDFYSGWLCQASNIKSESDISPYVDAFLVGEHLMEFNKEEYKNKILNAPKVKGN